MYILNSESGQTKYGMAEFLIDSEADAEKLPKSVPLGSCALTMDTGILFFLREINGERKWIAMSTD